MPTVYLAGPITGLDFKGATDWREHAKKELAKSGIKGLSPMRGKEYLQDLTTISAECAIEGAMNVLSSPKGIMTRDSMDCMRCDALLVNLACAKTVSIGTVMEIAWCWLLRKPIIAVMETPRLSVTSINVLTHETREVSPEIRNVHEHAMIDQAISYRVETLDEGIHLVRAVLEAYV